MYPTFNIKCYLIELLRPWKLVTFSIALGFYIWGAYFYHLPTWDVPISILMSLLTYMFAPLVVKTLLYIHVERPENWIGKLLMCLLITYVCASASYEIYHMTIGIGYHPPTFWPNLYYSSLIFLAAGIFWKFEGTSKELLGGLLKNTTEKFKEKPGMFTIFWIFLLIVLFTSFYDSLMLDQF